MSVLSTICGYPEQIISCSYPYPPKAKINFKSNGKVGHVEYAFKLNGKTLGEEKKYIFDKSASPDVQGVSPISLSNLKGGEKHQLYIAGTYFSDHVLLKTLRKILPFDFSENFQSKPITFLCAQESEGGTTNNMVFVQKGTIEDLTCENYQTLTLENDLYVDIDEVSYFEFMKLLTDENRCSLEGAKAHSSQFPYRIAYKDDGNMDINVMDNLPMVHVDQEDAQCYCEKLGKRLPTSKEWEYIARGGIFYKKYASIHLQNECLVQERIDDSVDNMAHPLKVNNINCNAFEWTVTYTGDPVNRIVRGGGSFEARYNSFCEFEERNINQGFFNVGFRCVKEAKNQ